MADATVTCRPSPLMVDDMSSVVTQSVVFGRAFADAIIAGLSTLAGTALLATAKLRLSHDPAYNPLPDTLLADLEAQEALYSGYPAGGVAVALSAPLNVAVGIEGAVQSHLWIATNASPFVGDSITGWWIDNGTDMLLASPFGDLGPVSIGLAGDFLNLLGVLPVGMYQPTV